MARHGANGPRVPSLRAALGLGLVVLAGCARSASGADGAPPDAGAALRDAAPDLAATPPVDAARADVAPDEPAPLDEPVVAPPDASAFDAAAQDTAAPPRDVVAAPDADAYTDATAIRDARPDAPPDARRDPPPLRAYSRGACPRLVAGPTAATSLNTGFRTGSQTREFRVIVPRNYDGASDWPVLFGWHWLNASGSSLIREGELETAAELMRFIAVVPEALRNSSGDRAYRFTWPFFETWGADAELTFFDDMLACVSAQFRVDRRRVYATGASAGALWVTYLSTTDRANYLAAVQSLSGGLGEQAPLYRMEYAPQANKFPALVLWGGPTDWLILSFDRASQRYRDELRDDDHFVVQCVHDAGHGMPPLPPPPDGGTRFRPLWQFLLDHTYGLAPGDSPYLRAGLPRDMPSWCSIVPPRP